MVSRCVLLFLISLALFASAQQPTPFIPATHTGYTIPTPQTTPSNPQRPKITLSSPGAPHFFPLIAATFRYSKTATNSAGAGDVSSVWQALSSVQSTWTAGAEYAKITGAVYEAAPRSARSSLSMSGYNWDDIVQEPWYNDVSPTAQSSVKAQEEDLQKIFDSMVPSAKAASSGPKSKGFGMGTKSLGGLVLFFMVGMWIRI